MDQARIFKRQIGNIGIQIDPVYVIVSPCTDWKAENVVNIQMLGGNITETGGPLVETCRLSSESLLEATNGTPLPSLSGLCNKTFKVRKKYTLSNTGETMRFINNQLWVCQREGIIQVFNLNLKQVKIIQNEAWGFVRDVSLLENGELVVATSNGLFHTFINGQQISRNRIRQP